MNFEYTHPEGSPSDPFEVAVMDAGYKWVRTNTIVATRERDSQTELPIDRLNLHKHSGHNTHLIVEGDLKFDLEKDFYSQAKFKRKRVAPPVKTATLDAADPAARKELYAAAEHRYKATSQSGGTFVEGHQLLSPSTAERFMSRDTLRAIPPLSLDGGEAEEMPWTEQDEIRDLLRTARWYPRGIPSIDNYGKPEMVWDEDRAEAGREEQRTTRLRSGRRMMKVPRGENNGDEETERTRKPGGNSKEEDTVANTKKLLADWFKEEWKDYHRTDHREPDPVEYDYLYPESNKKERVDEATGSGDTRGVQPTEK
ncbi:hypothetical protein PGQ11_014638 [Apiospora arundinis]|uniref:Uncharacterized protein n=1 Tax=Apiospora arundinis TaxID=335852 RepID=A0ABR2HU92_9PEZI